MSEHDFVALCQSDSDVLLNTLSAMLKAGNDTTLARTLRLGDPIFSMIRDRTLVVNATVLNSILQAAGVSIQEVLSFVHKHDNKSAAGAAFRVKTSPSAPSIHLQPPHPGIPVHDNRS